MKTNKWMERNSDGTARVAGSRVSMASVVYGLRDGSTPTQLVEDFPSLTLEQVDGAVAWYGENTAAFDEELVALEAVWAAEKEGGKKATLDARLVIGGLWEGAPILLHLPDGQRREYIWSATHEDGRQWVCRPPYNPVRTTDLGWKWKLSLRLPGPLGCGAHGLERRIQERLDGVEVVPGWCWGPAAEVSKRLVMLDGLAAKLGWATGAGAPVYGWGFEDGEAHGTSGWYLTGPDGECWQWPAGGDDTAVPMEALEATWRSECGA